MLFPPHFLRLLALAAACLLAAAGPLDASETNKQTFAIPAGEAESTLRQFSLQSGVQFIFDSDKVSGVRTAELRGDFAPREALDRMFAGTGFFAMQNERTGALTLVQKTNAPKSAPRAAPPAGDRPAEPALRRQAGTGTIEGRVLNTVTGSFRKNARIHVVGTRLETFTNENGEYRLADVPAGEVHLAASFTGLPARSATFTVVPGDRLRRDFELTLQGDRSDDSRVVRMEALTVEARELNAQAVALHERRNAPNIKNVVAIEVDTGEGKVGEFLKYVPGIGIDQSPQNPQFVSIRGMPASGTVVTTNGMEMASNSYTSGRETDFGVAATGKSFGPAAGK